MAGRHVRIVALDVGEARIGVAVSDELGWIAQGLDTIYTKGMARDVQAVAQILSSYQTGRVLIGLPLNMDGSEGFQAERSRAFGEALEQLGLEGLEIRYWDERLTTASARRTLIEGGVSRKKRKTVVDKLAAAYILQSFLDAGGWMDEERKQSARKKGMDHMMEKDNVVELIDENEQVVKFEHIFTLEHENQEYVLLSPLEPVEDVEEDEVVILRIEEDESGEDTYVGIEDDELLETLFQKYLELAEEDEDSEDDDSDEDDE